MKSTERLNNIATSLREQEFVPTATPREMLSWFGGQRRGSWIVWLIRESLATAGLTTDPEFESAYIDAPLEFKLLSAHAQTDGSESAPDVIALELSGSNSNALAAAANLNVDPTYRVSRLEAANHRPLSVTPNQSVAAAVTLMLQHDYSQLPVMVNERDVKGVVSWQSIGTRLGFTGKVGNEVREVMDPYVEIPATASLFDAIPLIISKQYVLVRAQSREIVGIVTASDLSLQFKQLSEPFLLLGEIENHIRRILGSRLNIEELANGKSPADDGRTISRVDDLTFGEYLRLIESPLSWEKLGLSFDRASFVEQLERARRIRNDVMHFDPDGIPPDDLQHLRKTASFLQKMREIEVS